VSEWQQVSSSNARFLLLLAHLQGIAAKIIGIAPAQINLDQPLKTLGFDSLMAVEMRTQLSVDLGVDIPLTMFAEEVTVTSVATFVNEQLMETLSPVSVTAKTNDEQISEQMLIELNQLTDAEIDTLLSSVLSN
jgi:acyl carrier protein